MCIPGAVELPQRGILLVIVVTILHFFTRLDPVQGWLSDVQVAGAISLLDQADSWQRAPKETSLKVEEALDPRRLRKNWRPLEC